MNIPIFRAKKIDSDECVEGYLLPEHKGKFYLATEWSRDFDGDTPNFIQIDPTTLSIHFPDMIDSQGNKIFASLQEDGKGGDILFDMEYEFTLIFDGLNFRLEGLYSTTGINGYDKFTNFDSIGIQK